MIVSCPSCQRNYVVADEQIAGKQFRARCKSCGEEFRLDGTPNRGATSGQSEPEPEHFMSATERFLALQSAPPPGISPARPSGKPPSVPPADKDSTASSRKASAGANSHGTWSVCLSPTDTRRMTTEEISAALIQGTITTGVFVWKSGMSKWLRMADVPELVAHGTGKPMVEGESKPEAQPKATVAPPTSTKPAAPQRSGRSVPPSGSSPPKPVVPAEPAAAPEQAGQATNGSANSAPKSGLRRTATIGGVGAVSPPTPSLPLPPPADHSIAVDAGASSRAPVPSAQPASGQQASTVQAPPGQQASTVQAPPGQQASTVQAPPEQQASTVQAPPEQQASTVQAPPGQQPDSTVQAQWVAGREPAMPRTRVSESYAPVVKNGDRRRVAGTVVAAGVVGLVGVLAGAMGAAYVMKSAMGIVTPPASAAAVVVLNPQPATPGVAPAPAPEPTPLSIPAGSEAKVGASPAASAQAATAQAATEPTKPVAKVQQAAPASRAMAKPAEHSTPPNVAVEIRTVSAKPSKAADPVVAEPAAGAAPIEREAAMAVLGLAAARAATCKKPDGPTGTVKIYVTFDPTGAVVMSNVVGSPIAGTPVGQCIAGWFRRVKVAPFSGDRVSFTKEVTIQ